MVLFAFVFGLLADVKDGGVFFADFLSGAPCLVPGTCYIKEEFVSGHNQHATFQPSPAFWNFRFKVHKRAQYEAFRDGGQQKYANNVK